MVWCGVVWCGVVWCDVVWCDLLTVEIHDEAGSKHGLLGNTVAPGGHEEQRSGTHGDGGRPVLALLVSLAPCPVARVGGCPAR
jgi:hypothetical protein